MNEVRATFLATSRGALELVASPEVAASWDEPSALYAWKVSGLTGHLVRATTSVAAYLDRDEPEGVVLGPGEYYARILDTADLESNLHAAIRQRGDEEAAEGPAVVAERLRNSIEALEPVLEREGSHRRVRVFKDLVLTLNDYLRTRIVELVVHIDDLAESVKRPASDHLTPAATTIAISVLVDIARARHGDLAVVKALARRERDSVDALHVL